MSDTDAKDWKKFREELESQEELAEESPSSTGTEEEKNPESIALEHPNYAVLEEKLTLAEQQAHENWEKAMRAVAELKNAQRRAEQEIEKSLKYGLEKFVAALLPVIDSLEQALSLAGDNSEDSMVEGLKLTLKLFLDALEKQGVKQLDPLGEAFNPQEHEAMSILEVPDAEPNSVVNVFQKGYKLNDRVIRPARVIVAKKTNTME